MDSTTVHLVTEAATKLGMTGASAFGWYLAATIGTHVLWALVVVFVLYRASWLIDRYTQRNGVLDAWYKAKANDSRPWGWGQGVCTSLLEYISKYDPNGK